MNFPIHLFAYFLHSFYFFAPPHKKGNYNIRTPDNVHCSFFPCFLLLSFLCFFFFSLFSFVCLFFFPISGWAPVHFFRVYDFSRFFSCFSCFLFFFSFFYFLVFFPFFLFSGFYFTFLFLVVALLAVLFLMCSLHFYH